MNDSGLGGQYCEYPCQGLADCPSLDTICEGRGHCALNLCQDEDGLCTVQVQWDGTCLPVPIDGVTRLICVQGGQAAGPNCASPGSRANLAAACVAGEFCTPYDGCQAPCDPTNGGGASCNGGAGYPPVPTNPRLGFCQG